MNTSAGEPEPIGQLAMSTALHYLAAALPNDAWNSRPTMK
jgi:hypothetical protein